MGLCCCDLECTLQHFHLAKATPSDQNSLKSSLRRTIPDSGQGEAHLFYFSENATVLGSVSNVITRVWQLEQQSHGLPLDSLMAA